MQNIGSNLDQCSSLISVSQTLDSDKTTSTLKLRICCYIGLARHCAAEPQVRTTLIAKPPRSQNNIKAVLNSLLYQCIAFHLNNETTPIF